MKMACPWEHVAHGLLSSVVSILQSLGKLFLDSEGHWPLPEPGEGGVVATGQWLRAPDLPLRGSGISGNLLQFSKPSLSQSLKWLQK